MARSIQWVLLFTLTLFSLYGQYSPGRDWKEMETDHHRFIFPASMTMEAIRSASLAEEYHPLLRADLNLTRAYEFPIILTGEDLTANGYVATFPMRSVWFSRPVGEGMGTTEWYRLLAVHEGRHMAQYERLNHATSHLLRLLGGDAWASIAIGVIPTWILEGDAVYSETELTLSGRGRLKAFSAGWEALAYEERDYSYAKMRHGSFKDFIPNAYEFGYPLMAWMQDRTDGSAMETILDSIARAPLPLLGYSRGVNRAVDLPPRLVYERAFQERVHQLAEENRNLRIEGTPLGPPNRIYTEYDHLNLDGSGRLIAVKWDLESPRRLTRPTPRGDEDMGDISPFTTFRLSGNRLLWDEKITSLPYSAREEAILNWVRNGEKREIPLGRGIFPSFYADGDSCLAYLELSEEHRFNLVLLDMEGNRSDTIPLPGSIYSASHLTSRGETLLMVVLSDEGEALWQWRREEGFTPLTPFTTQDLSSPVPYGEGLFLVRDTGKEREICYLGPQGLRQVTSTPFGADSPLPDPASGRLYFTLYAGSRGEEIRYLPLAEVLSGAPLMLAPPATPRTSVLPSSPVIRDYQPHRPFQPVGWGVTTLAAPRDDRLEIPFALISKNEMNTLLWESGIYYNLNEQTPNYRFYASFSPSYLTYTLRTELNQRRRQGSAIHDLITAGGIYAPLGRIRGRDLLLAEGSFQGAYQYSWAGSDRADAATLSATLSLTHSRSGGYRSLQPLWEEAVSATLRFSPAGNFHHVFGSARLLVPGFAPSHGMGFYAYLEQNPEEVLSAVPTPRGYAYEPHRDGFFISGEYVFPLFYPDFALGSLFYCPRIGGALFWEGDGEKTSLGGEITARINPLSLDVAFEGGLYYAWLPGEKRTAWGVRIKGFSF